MVIMHVMMLNKIYEWTEPEQQPMTRMFLTRVGGIVCAFFELIAVGEAALKIFSGSKFSDVKKSVEQLCRLIIGLASTILIGIVFSPAVNYRIHIGLEIVLHDVTLRKEKQVQLNAQRQIVKAQSEADKLALLAKLTSF